MIQNATWDITEKEVIEKFIKQVIEKYNKVDFVVNNAGLSKCGLLTCDYENFLYVQKFKSCRTVYDNKTIVKQF